MVAKATNSPKQERWSSNTGFLLAAIGGAVGLGNLWRFPFIAGENGGGAFVLIYLAFVVLLSVPIMIAELAMGRRGQGSAVGSMHNLIGEAGAGNSWKIIGWLSVLVPLLGLSFYSVVAGWSLDYIFKASVNGFSQFTGADSENAFQLLLANPSRLLLFHTLFIAGVVYIVARGVSKGIELISKIMIPALFVLLLVLAINSIFNADIQAGLDFLFNPDFSKLTPTVVFMALGQAFFSLAIGVGMLITYGAYVPKEISLPKAALTISLADSGVALLAGIVIFPLVFSHGLDPAGGPGLIFVTLPIAFGNMPAGYIVGLLFFLLLFFAAFSTGLAMLEPAVSWLEERKSSSRTAMAILTGITSWALGIAAALSYNVWGDVRLFDFVALLKDKNIFDLLDFVVSAFFIPINAVLVAIFAGWVMSNKAMLEELGIPENAVFTYIRFVIRYVAPIVISAILYTNLVL